MDELQELDKDFQEELDRLNDLQVGLEKLKQKLKQDKQYIKHTTEVGEEN